MAEGDRRVDFGANHVRAFSTIRVDAFQPQPNVLLRAAMSASSAGATVSPWNPVVGLSVFQVVGEGC